MEEKATIAKSIIKKYLLDAYSERFSSEKIDEMLDGVNVRFSDLEVGKAGTYQAASNVLLINNSEEKNGVLLTIMHELGHYMSNKCSKGERISSFMEEGMVNVFAEKCMNHFIRTTDEEVLQQYGIDGSKVWISQDDYLGEADFSRSLLEAAKQINGSHEEIEYEYFFGSKDKVRELCVDALGEDVLRVFAEQARDNLLGKDGAYKYREQLTGILESKGITFSTPKKEEDGKINVYANRSSTLETVARSQEVAKKVEEFYVEATAEPTYEKLISLSQQYGICNKDLISRLSQSGKFETVDLIKFASSVRGLDIRGFSDAINMDGLTVESVQNLDANTRKNTLALLATYGEENEQLLGVVNALEEDLKREASEQGDNVIEQLYVSKAKYVLDSENKGENLVGALEILKGIDSAEADVETITFTHGFKENFTQYLEEYAADDKEGKNKLVGFFADFQGIVVEGEAVDMVSTFYKDTYYSKVYEDLSKIKDIYMLDEAFSREVYDNAHYSGEGSYIPKQGLTVDMLARVSRQTTLIDIFDENNVRNVLCQSGITDSFEGLSEQEKNIVLNAMEQLNLDETYIPGIREEVDYVKAMLGEETNESLAKRKEVMLQAVSERVGRREKPIEDLRRILPYGEADAPTTFVIDRVSGNLMSQIENGNLVATLEDVAEVASRTRKVPGIESGVVATTNKALEEQLKGKQYTTESFIAEVSRFYNVDNDVMIENYLRSMGKDTPAQREMLKKVMSISYSGDTVIHPQYITYENNGETKNVLLTHSKDGIIPHTNDGVCENDPELLEVQNRGKKGIRSIFKSKKAKEYVRRTAVLNTNEQGEKSVLNIYETGRVELVVMDEKMKRKQKRDLRVSDVGYNAKMIETSEQTMFGQSINHMTTRDMEYLNHTTTTREKEKTDDYTI